MQTHRVRFPHAGVQTLQRSGKRYVVFLGQPRQNVILPRRRTLLGPGPRANQDRRTATLLDQTNLLCNLPRLRRNIRQTRAQKDRLPRQALRLPILPDHLQHLIRPRTYPPLTIQLV